jgi:hypothetical protein
MMTSKQPLQVSGCGLPIMSNCPERAAPATADNPSVLGIATLQKGEAVAARSKGCCQEHSAPAAV